MLPRVASSTCIVLLSLLFALLSPALAMAPVKINVSGSHSVRVPAELCEVKLTVSKEASTQKEAYDAVAATSNELATWLRDVAPKTKTKTAGLAVQASDKGTSADSSDSNASGVVVWSMQSLSTSTYRPYPNNWQEGDKKPEKVYRVSTGLRVNFADFKALSSSCLDWSRVDLISIDNLNWRLTKATETSLQRQVRQGALREATTRASDYASVYLSAGKGDGALSPQRLVPKDITDNAGGGHLMYASMAPGRARAFKMGGGGDEDGETLSFEPEDVEVSAEVTVAFELDLGA